MIEKRRLEAAEQSLNPRQEASEFPDPLEALTAGERAILRPYMEARIMGRGPRLRRGRRPSAGDAKVFERLRSVGSGQARRGRADGIACRNLAAPSLAREHGPGTRGIGRQIRRLTRTANALCALSNRKEQATE
jgi:hypothetical protein